MKILYLGHSSTSSTSFHRAKALERVGNEVDILDPYEIPEKLNRFVFKFHYLTGFRFLQGRMKKWARANVVQKGYDVVWVNSGELLGNDVLDIVKSTIDKPLVLYNNDDPTGGRDGRRFDTLMKAIPKYDLCAVMRDINMGEYYRAGAKKVVKVFMSYDEVIHAPLEASEIGDAFRSEVSFIGTNIPNEKRDVFLHALIEKGVPLSIWGNRWERSPYWNQIRPFVKGKSLKGKNYTAAIQGSKICLGLLSAGNRDLYTRRSFEIPYIGTLFCAERTKEHLELFEENKEAIFWSNADECAEKCLELLANDDKIEEIAENGRQRVLNDQRGNEDVVSKILDELIETNR